MSEHYVYGYRYDGEWIYIGHGKGRRMYVHLYPSTMDDRPFYNKLREIIANGDMPDIVVLHEGLSKEEAKKKEYELINQIGLISEGGSLLNVMKRDGGSNVMSMLGVKGSNNPNTKPIIATNLLTGKSFIIYSNYNDYGFNQGHVSSCCNGKLKSHKGYIFKFA